MKLFDRGDAAAWSDIHKVEGVPMTGVRVRVALRGEEVLMLEVNLEEGTKIPSHRHAHESLCFVLEGRISLTIGENTFVAGPGDAFFHPPEVEHAAEAIEACRWVEVKSPPDETG